MQNLGYYSQPTELEMLGVGSATCVVLNLEKHWCRNTETERYSPEWGCGVLPGKSWLTLVRAALQVHKPVWSAQGKLVLLSGSGSCSPSSSPWGTQSDLIIHGSHLCKVTYSLTFLCSPQVNTLSTFSAIHVSAQSGKKFESPDTHAPSWGQTRLCLLALALIL